MSIQRKFAGIFAAVLFFASSGCEFLGGTAPLPGQPADLRIETVVANAATPVDLAFAPDGRVFFTEKNSGRIRVIKDGTLLADPFATLPVNNLGERGLLGIALHPDFASNGYIYVYYSRSSTGAVSDGFSDTSENRIVRFTAVGDQADGPEEPIASLPAGAAFHNGGSIRFGPDGKLYASLGDLGTPDDSQDEQMLNGKILRMNDDGSMPGDNPLAASSFVFAIGLRNPFGLGFDDAGRLYANENGPSNHDEVLLVTAGSNQGWPNVQGLADDAFGDPAGEVTFAAARPAYRDPLVDKSDGSDGAAGLAINPGDVYGAELRGDIFYGHHSPSRVMHLSTDATGTAAVEQSVFATDLPGGVNGMAFDADGVLWVCTTNAIVRLLPDQP